MLERYQFRGVNSLKFYRHFITKDTCCEYLSSIRWGGSGFACKKCGNTHFCKGRLPYSRRCTRCKYDESPATPWHTWSNSCFHRCGRISGICLVFSAAIRWEGCFPSGLHAAFTGVAASSPSVWIKDWLQYVQGYPTRAQQVYMSWGDKEELVKNKAIAQVSDNVREYHKMFVAQLREVHTALEWNAGNHFQDGVGRTARGFAWCLKF